MREDILQEGLRESDSVLKSGIKPLSHMQVISMAQKVTNPHHIQTHVRLVTPQMQNLPITKRVFPDLNGQVNDQIATDRSLVRKTQHVLVTRVHSL